MRESDVLAFEIALRESNPGAVMCAYNKINGVYACEDDYTLNDVLKKERRGEERTTFPLRIRAVLHDVFLFRIEDNIRQRADRDIQGEKHWKSRR